MYDWPQTLAADRSVNALWPLAAGCHYIYIVGQLNIAAQMEKCNGYTLLGQWPGRLSDSRLLRHRTPYDVKVSTISTHHISGYGIVLVCSGGV